MKVRVLIAWLSVLMLVMPSAQGAGGSTGIGVIVGEPTGITFKTWLSETRAVDFAAAWSFSENDSLQLHGDYLIHNPSVLKPLESTANIPIYYGLGVRVKFEEQANGGGRNTSHNLFGIRIPFGVTYIFKGPHIDMFAEIVPVMDVSPDTDFDMNAAFGARLYF